MRLRAPSRWVMVGVALVTVFGCAKKPVSLEAVRPATTLGGTGVVSSAQPGAASPAAAGAPAASASRPAVPQAPAIAAAPPSPVTFREHPALQDLHFAFDRYEIRNDAAVILNRNVEWLKAHPSVKVLIEGHCDERGTTEYNLALGERRAKSTQNYLMVHGIQSDRIALISYGKERPLCTERAETCWAKNRRAHFLIKE